MKNKNHDYGFTTITNIKTENPKVLDTIIKDGKLDLTATPSKETHVLKNFYSTMRWAEIETKNGSFRDVGEQLSRLFPDTTIQLDEMTYFEGYNTRRVYEYQNGRCERISKTECELRIESVEHLVGYKISQELEFFAQQMHHFLHDENLWHLDYKMLFDDMTIITRLNTTTAKFEIDREQIEEEDDGERTPVSHTTTITTHNPEILGSIIKDGKLYLRGFRVRHEHDLWEWDHQLKQAEVYTQLETFEEIAIQLSQCFPNEFIKCKYVTDDPFNATKEVVEYINGEASVVVEKEPIPAILTSRNFCRKVYDAARDKIYQIVAVMKENDATVVGCSFFIDRKWQVRTGEVSVVGSSGQERKLVWGIELRSNFKNSQHD